LQKNILKERKKVIIFLSLLLIFGLSLAGCNWFENGIINIFDPQAQIRVNYSEINLGGESGDEENLGTISLEIYSLNQVEFIGEGFNYKYYNNGVLITDLTRTVGATFYVAPSSNPGSPGDITQIDNMPLYFQKVLDYIKMNPTITELACTITLIGTDGAGHSISKSVTFDLPAIQPGIDFEPPVANISTVPSPPTGNIPLTVIFDASGSTDNRGINSYSWNLGDGTTSSSITVTNTYDNPGSYVVTLTVTDYFDNQDTEIVIVEVGDSSGPTIPDPPSVAVGQNITFDGTNSTVSGDCGSGTTIESYSWNFDDGYTGSGSIVNHSYDTAGTYNVTLTVTDSNGKSSISSVEVTVT